MQSLSFFSFTSYSDCFTAFSSLIFILYANGSLSLPPFPSLTRDVLLGMQNFFKWIKRNYMLSSRLACSFNLNFQVCVEFREFPRLWMPQKCFSMIFAAFFNLELRMGRSCNTFSTKFKEFVCHQLTIVLFQFKFGFFLFNFVDFFHFFSSGLSLDALLRQTTLFQRHSIQVFNFLISFFNFVASRILHLYLS